MNAADPLEYAVAEGYAPDPNYVDAVEAGAEMLARIESDVAWGRLSEFDRELARVKTRAVLDVSLSYFQIAP